MKILLVLGGIISAFAMIAALIGLIIWARKRKSWKWLWAFPVLMVLAVGWFLIKKPAQEEKPARIVYIFPPVCLSGPAMYEFGNEKKIRVQLYNDCFSGLISLPKGAKKWDVITESSGGLEYEFWNGKRAFVPDEALAWFDSDRGVMTVYDQNGKHEYRVGKIDSRAFRLRGSGQAEIMVEM